MCYVPKLGLGCILDKDLSKREENGQSVKHKDIGLYLLLYISIDHKKSKRYPCLHKKESKKCLCLHNERIIRRI